MPPAGRDPVTEVVTDIYAEKARASLPQISAPWTTDGKTYAKPFASRRERIAFRRSLDQDERRIMERFPFVTLEQMHWRREVMRGGH